jgi:beta-lactam-binding protein with PASTA domain
VVPNVVGLDVNDALSGLTRLGLPVNVTVAASTGSLAVTHESPSAGATARRGTAVTLQVGRAGSSGCS